MYVCTRDESTGGWGLGDGGWGGGGYSCKAFSPESLRLVNHINTYMGRKAIEYINGY